MPHGAPGQGVGQEGVGRVPQCRREARLHCGGPLRPLRDGVAVDSRARYATGHFARVVPFERATKTTRPLTLLCLEKIPKMARGASLYLNVRVISQKYAPQTRI